jgi:hypothetical protein
MSIAQNIPLNFRVSPMPDENLTPQQYADALVARLTAESTNTISFFAAGSVAPTSNVGPWLKDNESWYVWSDSLGMYVPQTIASGALGYIAQQAPGPDHTVYTFWIQLDGAGKAQSIQYYSSGAWHDVYDDKFNAIYSSYSTTAAMNAAIAAAVGGATARAYPAAATQVGGTILLDGIAHTLTPTEYIDPDLVYSAGTYTCPVNGYYRISAYAQLDNLDASSADVEVGIQINNNGFYVLAHGTAVPLPPGDRWYPSVNGITMCSAGDLLTVALNGQDGVGTHYLTITNLVVSFELVQSA